MTPQEILAKAADLIEEHGWVQKKMGGQRKDGTHAGYCVVSAIFKAAGEVQGPRIPEPVKLLHQVINTYDLFKWNDRIERTKDEVVTALREASRLE